MGNFVGELLIAIRERLATFCRFRLGYALAIYFGFILAGVPLTAAAAQVWYVDQKTINQVDTETFTIVQSSGLSDQAVSIAIDTRDKSVWVLANTEIYKYNSSFGLQFSSNLTSLYRSATSSNAAFPNAEHLAINPYDGSVWISGGKNILHLKDDGTALQAWSAGNVIDDIELGVDEYLWVLTSKNVIQLNKFGTISNSFAIDNAKQNPRYQAIDNLRALLWLADKGQLQSYSLSDVSLPPSTFLISGKSPSTFQPTGLTGDIASGNVWTTDDSTLYQYNAEGTLLKNIDLATVGIKNPLQLMWDPVGKVLWVADDTHLAAFNGSSDLIGILPAKKIQAVATDNLLLQPYVELTSPTANSFINIKRPPLVFKVSATCNYSPCLNANLYADHVFLNVTLDDLSIGQSILLTSGTGAYTPIADLAEGQHQVGGYGIGPFGHISNVLDSQFTIDTIPPVFQNLNPADGSIILNNPVTLTGHADDATTVQVTLKDSNGQVVGSGGSDFSFDLTLAQGANVFELAAVDAAGNETRMPLHLTLGQPLKIQITQPANGSSVSGNKIYVAGTFDAPINSGISVNGVLAQSAGHTFLAEIPVEVGTQAVTAKIVTFGGGSAETSISVNVVPPPIQDKKITYGLEVTANDVPEDVALIDTIAGNGKYEFTGDDGPAKDAGLMKPTGIAVGPDNAIYFTDEEAHRIRRIDGSGNITTVAGSGPVGRSNGSYAGDGGQATDARFNNPSDVAFASDGSMIIADSWNGRVRKVDSNGVITTIAGNGTGTYPGDGSLAVNAGLRYPVAVAVAPDQSIYIADSDAQRIYRVAADGTIATVAGNGTRGFSGDGGPATSARLSFPWGMVFTPDGSLYFADSDNNRVRRVSPDGTINTVALAGYPVDVAIDDTGSLYIDAAAVCQVLKITADGTRTRYAGTRCGYNGEYFGGDGAPADKALISDSYGIALDANGTLLVADSGNRRIRKVFTPTGIHIVQANLNVYYSLHYNTNDRPTVTIDYDNDGITDFISENSVSYLRLTHYYPEPGAYLITVKFSWPNGDTHVEQHVVTIEDVEGRKQMLTDLWNEFNQALRRQDVAAASMFLNTGARRRYVPAFEALAPHMNEIIDSYSDLFFESFQPGIGEFSVTRDTSGRRVLYLIYFMQDPDGIWRLDAL